MSVCLLMLPVALAMRVVMGQENFEQWVNSMQVTFPTNFKDETDLVRTIKRAGYDAEKWGSTIKTHINAEKAFFFWELRDHCWSAVFSKYDSKENIQWFIQDLEAKSNRRIFHMEGQTDKIKVEPTPKYPTNFCNGQLLRKTLNEYGATIKTDLGSSFKALIGEMSLQFSQQGEAPFTVEIETTSTMSSTFAYLSLLDEDYKRNVQEATYERVKQKLAERNLCIENEEVLEDNSIVLTVVIES
ncbi:hypothetical protein AXX12_07020 [Anaerosporomusa subterranea]|uniref:Uncharacterized protein n=1 Tax=Anaerosporomusa subterranea TaxID=1794912 RepID=A0A154BRN7_ANASB|nr:hypothetical protein [Anaerosporomusa subterranea]KYZ76188.1 hypothetical protein AXX12_07020 [Anaerosporomusa subterranea]